MGTGFRLGVKKGKKSYLGFTPPAGERGRECRGSGEDGGHCCGYFYYLGSTKCLEELGLGYYRDKGHASI